MSDDDFDIESVLRASLADNARQAPRGDQLAEQIIAAADHPRPERDFHRPRTSRWRTWTLPLVAAGSVAAVIAALVGASQFNHHTTATGPAAPTPSDTVALTTAPTATASPSISPTPTAPTTPSQASSTSAPPQPLTAFRAIDLTYVSETEGWALGTADCLDKSGQTCAAIQHTTDGGANWTSIPTFFDVPATNTSCVAACVEHIRFADSETGYAYGQGALYLTTNGGQTWRQQPGGAEAIETLNDTVLRVSVSHAGCAPGCTFSVQKSAVGGSTWQDVTPSGAAIMGVSATLSRTGDAAYLLVKQHVAGGASNATSTLFASADNGATWARRGEPCPQSGDEVDSVALTTAPDGSVTVVCQQRTADGLRFTATSTDGGASFVPGDLHALGSASLGGVGAATSRVLFVASDKLYRSTDGGSSWHQVAVDPTTGTGSASFLGFGSATTGRWISGDGSRIWTTTDSGAHWTAHTFR